MAVGWPTHAELDSDTELDRWLVKRVRTGYHACGTCRMGSTGDPASVVTPDLKVIGLSNVWVADASIMPTIPTAFTNLTTFMIAEKFSDHFIKDEG
jgi:choline dehydrogenase-like flavoprotein